MGLHFGGFGVNLGALLAREPLNMRVNPLMRTSTPQDACGRRCRRGHHRVNVRDERPGQEFIKMLGRGINAADLADSAQGAAPSLRP